MLTVNYLRVVGWEHVAAEREMKALTEEAREAYEAYLHNKWTKKNLQR